MGKNHSLIVGGTRGMGRALVRAFAEEGHVVSVIGRRPPPEADRHIADVHYWFVDLLEQERLSAALAEITERNGKLSNLIFFQRYRGDGDSWAGEIETSLTATKYVIERMAGELEGAVGGSIVIVSSIVSQFISEEQDLSYHVAKAGLNQMMRYYAFHLAPRGIRVNCVSPDTTINEESSDFYRQNERLSALYKSIVPLGRTGTSEDVAQVIAFLCSPQASFITGQNIVVDGGLSLQGQGTLARKLAL